MGIRSTNKTFAKFSRLFLHEVKKMSFDQVDIKETGSMIELLNFPRTQSIMSRLGFAIERAFVSFLHRTPGVKSLKSSRDLSRYGHQLDLLFRYRKTIYYFEIKSNLNLDTEKSKSVVNKLRKLKRTLKKQYPKSNIVSAVLSARYSRGESIRNIKHPIRPSHVYGYSDFFDIFNVPSSPTHWKRMFKRVGKHIQKSQNEF
jgi:hypothetical protein